MKRSLTYLTLIIFLFAGKSFSQFNRTKFLYEFRMADHKEKIKLLSNVEYGQIWDIYPLIKDTVEMIRVKINKNSSSKEARFLFDKIDVSREIYEKKFAKAAITMENSLQNHARNMYDSLACYSHLKDLYVKLSNLNKAIEANHIYDVLAHRTKDENYIKTITKKSKICDIFGLHRQAIIEKRKEFNSEYKSKQTDTSFVASFYNDMGVYFNRLKLSDSALPYFAKADELITKKLAYDKETTTKFFKSLIEGNMALAYANKGEYVKAIPFLKNDIYYSMKVRDIESAFNSYVLISKCFTVLNELKTAQRYMDTAVSISNILNQPRVKLKLLYAQAELLDKEGNSTQSVYKFKEYLSLKDSISNNEKEMQLINQQVAMDMQNKEVELTEKNKQLQNARIQEAKQKAFRAYLMAGLVVLVLLIVFLFYTNNSSKKREWELSQKNEQIQIQNRQIETSLKEKELLLKEIHHRVKNNLQIISSVINLQADKTNDAEMLDMLGELRLRISSIALTHQMLYQKGSVNTVSMYEYLKNLITQITQSYESNLVKLNVELEQKEQYINIDTAIPLGLLVNEIITNSFKHAFKNKQEGVINFKAVTSGNLATIVISDNGNGLPANYKDLMEKANTLGFELISILTQQINAKLEIENNNGATFKISFTI